MFEDSGLRVIPNMILLKYLECERSLTCAAEGASEGHRAAAEQRTLPRVDHQHWRRSNLELTLPFIHLLHRRNRSWYLD